MAARRRAGLTALIYMTVSMGIGGGVIVDGRLLLGVQGLGAELGHVEVLPDGPKCGCGQRGHLEALAAGPAIARRARELVAQGHESALSALGEGLTARDVSAAAERGDPLAKEVLAEAGATIGRYLASLCHIFNPQVIVIGGGVSQAGPLLFEPMEAALREHVMHPAYLRELRLVRAALGDDAGLVGAMVLARMEAGRQD